MDNHRADIVGPDNRVLELQHSAINPKQIREREQFYDRMVWLFDVRDAESRIIQRRNGIFSWKHARKSVLTCKKPVFLDLGERGIVKVRKFLEPEPKDFFDVDLPGRAPYRVVESYWPPAFVGSFIDRQDFIEIFITGTEIVLGDNVAQFTMLGVDHEG